MRVPAIADLGLIGDRRTAALLDTTATVHWYCPGRFDRPALLTSLLAPETGGHWRLAAPGLAALTRTYLDASGVLQTTLATDGGPLVLTDFMPFGDDLPRGICRQLAVAPVDVDVLLRATPAYGRRRATLEASGPSITIDGAYLLSASHPLALDDGDVRFTVPAGEAGWAALLDGTSTPRPSADDLAAWLRRTLASWREIAARATYHGPYEEQVAASLRAIRLLTYDDNGATIAAPTTSLPEVPGGTRNYDYRYAWLRDLGMVVSALTRAGSDGTDERKFLAFVCAACDDLDERPRAPFYTLDGERAPAEEHLDLPGYERSRPVRVGNDAHAQLQFDAYGNVLLAAKLIYNRFDTRAHWPICEQLAEFLAAHWRDPDYGIWEEQELHHYTTSKVVAACGLEYIAAFASDAAQTRRWRAAASAIRTFVDEECKTPQGAYAVHAGSEAVDVSAALFPIWAYTEADTPAMRATIEAIDRDLRDGPLYRRRLVCADQAREGAFLVGSLWMAQYWVMRDLDRARAILEACFACANDLGLLAEEVDPDSGRLLGNFPQSFVHASLIGAVHDYKQALEGSA